MLDEKDIAILDLLKANAKRTSQDISRETGIPVTTVHNRIKRLEKEGIVKGYTVRIDHKLLGKGLVAFVLITVSYLLPSGSKLAQEDVAKKIGAMSSVEEVHIVTGGTDIIVKARVEDIERLNRFIINELRNIDGVENTQTIIVLNTVK